MGWSRVKDYYDFSIYKYGVDYRELTKYCINSELGEFGKDSFTDNKIILDPEDDAIIANWGGACQLKKNKTNWEKNAHGLGAY